MPHELSTPTPASPHETIITNGDLLWHDITSQDGVYSEELRPATWTPVEYGELAPLVSNGNTYQSLRGMVKAGHEVFGIVEVMGKGIEGVQAMVTRVSKEPGKRAELVGFVDKEEGLVVGRVDDITDKRLSRKHFQVGYTAEGELAVKDLDSTNGTEILLQKTTNADEVPEATTEASNATHEKVFLKSAKNLVRLRRKNVEDETSDAKTSPLKDWNIWSLKTHKVRAEAPRSNKERNAWLEQMLNDPERPLPEVSLRFVEDPVEIEAVEKKYRAEVNLANSRDKKKCYEVINSENEPVGIVSVIDPYRDREPAQKQRIGMIRIIDRGKGYGPSTYLEVLKSLPEGIGLQTDTVLTKDGSKKAWDRLVERGVARRVENDYGSFDRYETVF